MDTKSIKKYVQYRVRKSWESYPVPIPKKNIRILEIALYEEFEKLSNADQERYLFSEELVRILTFMHLEMIVPYSFNQN